MPEVVVDASPLQYLFQVELLDLLPTLYERILVPVGVASEIDAGLRCGLVLPDLASLRGLKFER